MVELLKDDKLSFMHEHMGCNIARYISTDPDMNIRYIKIDKDYVYKGDLKECILDLIEVSNSKSVNIRSFSLESMKGHSLVYGKRVNEIDEILNVIQKNCSENKYSIINETIDVNDGGVSGVILGNIIEFAPNDTPKCVEKPDICFLERNMGMHLLKTVYGFAPECDFDDNYRVEFSLHPHREGLRKSHTIIWEYEKFEEYEYDIKIKWPNKFSRFIGDKPFGLIIADYLGFNVPYTTVISRNVPPFSFGQETGLREKWIRTAPIVKEPGKYYTGDKWTDPFILMQEEELKGDNQINIASVLSQSAVEAVYSGGALIGKNQDNDVIEGVAGKGDNFMVGADYLDFLPDSVLVKLKALLNEIRKYYYLLGDVSIEWVFDGTKIWLVQLNQIKEKGLGTTIVAGEPTKYEKFYVEDGLEQLRSKINAIKCRDIGIELIGDVGLTSHFGDVLRHANIPSFISKISKK
jgi:hypothetical protein